MRQIAQAVNREPKKAKRSIGIVEWMAAFDRYALAADVTGQLPFGACLAHKNVCLRVAAKARVGGRARHLAVLYDELSRKAWSEAAYNGMDDFNLIVAAGRLDDDVLKLAEAEYDRRGSALRKVDEKPTWQKTNNNGNNNKSWSKPWSNEKPWSKDVSGKSEHNKQPWKSNAPKAEPDAKRARW